jgi:uncharacterized protein (TIGR02444 family)
MPKARSALNDWAKTAYAAPGVASLCLTLQNDYDQSVCLLLWAAWATRARGLPTVSTLTQAAELAKVWERTVVGPLRSARTGLATAPGLSEKKRKTLRDRIKASELTAERALLSALDAVTALSTPEPSEVVTAMEAAAAVWSLPVPRERLEDLAAAFPRE